MVEKGNAKAKRKISTKIMSSILVVNLVSLATFAGIVLFLINDRVGKEAVNLASTEVRATVNDFEQDFSNIENAVSVLVNEIIAEVDVTRAKAEQSYLQDYKKELVKRLASIGENTDLTRSIYVYFNVAMFEQEVDIWVLKQEDGSFELQESFGMEYYEDYNSWYSDPIDNHLTLWTNPYASSDGSNLITSFVTPVMVGNEAIAMVGMDLYMEDIQKALESIKVFETGYLYMMNPDGTVYIHPNIEFEDNIINHGEYKTILDEMAKQDVGFAEFKNSEGVDVVTAYSHLSNGWVVASAVLKREVMKVVSSIINIIIIVILASIVFAVAVSVIIGKSITRPIETIMKATEKIKGGDFTTVFKVSAKDETAVLAESLNEMTETVKDLIVEAKNASIDMVESASDLAAMSQETNATTEQVETTIQEITRGAQDTAKDAEIGAEIASKIERQFVTLMDNSNSMGENAGNVMSVNQEGLDALENLRSKSDESNKATHEVNDAVVKLNDNTKAITEIIATITSIAEQTNLLALNASIEAARAGEAGRGFAVVAEEIRKLAESSGSAAEEIRNIIGSINNDTEETVKVMAEMRILSEEQSKAVSHVNASFEQIFKSVESISSQIGVVISELSELNQSKSELVESVSNISAVSEETAAATEEVEASMAEQSRAMEHVAKSAEKLNILSGELNRKIEFFKV